MVTLGVNGRIYEVLVEDDTPLLWVIRDSIGLTGTKFGCGTGACGACMVLMGDDVVRSYSIPVSLVGNAMALRGISASSTDPAVLSVQNRR